MVFDAQKVMDVATQMRCDIVRMTAAAKSGHPGGSLSAADIMATLYFGDVLRHDPAKPNWDGRDRFILSKGHAAPVLYAALARAGYFPVEELLTLRQFGSRLQGHPDMHKLPGVEASTGSLGQGLSIAAGLALGLRMDANAAKVYVLLGDGELQEGQVWEAAMFAAHRQLDNLVAIVDYNGLQIDGTLDSVVALGDIAAKFEAFGWTAVKCDGHDVKALHVALTEAAQGAGGPVVVIADTIKGKGVSFMENQSGWHGKAPNADECACALGELEARDV